MGRVGLSRGAPAGLLLLAAAFLTAFVAPPPASASRAWIGGTFPVGDGEHVSVYVSSSYPAPEAAAQRWAAFFGALPHGKELSLVSVYVAPLDEVRELCLSADVLGCYRSQEIVMVGDSTSVAAHEYGHHVAANRSNAPWLALDWGTKRWATAAGVCARVGTGFAFPGDEGFNYALNPGEAFAESYRVLVETDGTAAAYTWPIVDPSFRPEPATLEAVREDVLHPWTSPVTKTVRGGFAGRARTSIVTFSTPLDGDLRIQTPGTADLTLLLPDGRTVLARSSWTSTGGKALGYRICGTRSVKLRVSRGDAGRRFTLRITRP